MCHFAKAFGRVHPFQRKRWIGDQWLYEVAHLRNHTGSHIKHQANQSLRCVRGLSSSSSTTPPSSLHTSVSPFSPLLMHGAQSHLKLVHTFLDQILGKGDIAIDATCGNGHDSVFLAKRVLSTTDDGLVCRGRLYCIDIQASAVKATTQALRALLSPVEMTGVRIIHQSHATFPKEICPRSVRAVVYNLGYLPGSDKSIITRAEDTIQSIQNALDLVSVSGMVCVTCYRGHPGGSEETEAVGSLARSLPPSAWSVYLHEPANRPVSPVVYTFYRNADT